MPKYTPNHITVRAEWHPAQGEHYAGKWAEIGSFRYPDDAQVVALAAETRRDEQGRLMFWQVEIIREEIR